MNYSTAVILINKNVRIVEGKYEDGGKIQLFKTLDHTLKIDDYAVVESGTRWGITTVKITKDKVYTNLDATAEVGWVVQKIDMPTHEKVKEMEARAIDIVARGEQMNRQEEVLRNTRAAMTPEELAEFGFAQIAPPETPPAPAPKQPGDNEPF